MIQVTQFEIWVDFSLVPRRSLLIRCPREVWERVSHGEYLSVTLQLMVEYRNDRAEKCLGT